MGTDKVPQTDVILYLAICSVVRSPRSATAERPDSGVVAVTSSESREGDEGGGDTSAVEEQEEAEEEEEFDPYDTDLEIEGELKNSADDVRAPKRFPHHWPIVRETTRDWLITKIQ